VNKLCIDFPEFTAAHLLKVRILEALGYEKQKELKLAAVYSMNRKKLHQLVTEVRKTTEVAAESTDESPDIIQFSEESNEQADVIIEQHAPYAGVEPGTDLLELEEEADEELLEIADEGSEAPLKEEQNEGPSEEVSVDPGQEFDEEHSEELAEGSTEELSEASAEEPDEELSAETDVDSAELPEEEFTAEVTKDSDSILTSLEKDDTDMEEPETMSDEVPAIDRLDEMEENSNNHLITNFIRGEPGPIRADRETSLKGDVSLASIREHDGFITDTLAQIYVKQGLYAKAIYAYEKLSLKYPEKSAYFAAQIEKIRNINHS
jgi:hypothetical protein